MPDRLAMVKSQPASRGEPVAIRWNGREELLNRATTIEK